jgi:hypothetical protein
MEIKEDRRDGVLVIALAGRVDSTTAPALEAHVGRLEKEATRRMVVDFSGVEYQQRRPAHHAAARQAGAGATARSPSARWAKRAVCSSWPAFCSCSSKPSQSAAVAAVTGV